MTTQTKELLPAKNKPARPAGGKANGIGLAPQNEFVSDVSERCRPERRTKRTVPHLLLAKSNGHREILHHIVEKKNYKKLVRDKIIKQLAKYGGITEQEIMERMDYYVELEKLQVELVKLQQWVIKEKKRIAIIFEGRDAAGKGGAIRRCMQHLMPRHARVVALPAPTEVEKGQWYFTRYIKELPNPGSIVFFDRSWYNRAVVEPVMNFCNEKQYQEFIRQVPDFEHMIYQDGIIVIKFWFSVSKDEQDKRFASRDKNPLKNWKLSSVDKKAQSLWDKFSYYKEQMFTRTHTNYAPWIIVRADKKLKARLESIRYVLSVIPYDKKEKAKVSLNPDPNFIGRYFVENEHID